MNFTIARLAVMLQHLLYYRQVEAKSRCWRYLRCNGDREYIPGVAGRLGYRAEYEEASQYHLIPCPPTYKGLRSPLTIFQ